MFSNTPIYILCVRAALALQVPQQATVSYTNISASAVTSASTTPGPLCCEVYPPGVALHHWYPGVQKVVDSIVVTNFLRYNSTFLQITIPIVNTRYVVATYTDCTFIDTIVPTSTITTFPSNELFANVYLADVDGPAPIPGLPTDLNGPDYVGAYDATWVENATVTTPKDNSTAS
jgi:hypothetical protein